MKRFALLLLISALMMGCINLPVPDNKSYLEDSSLKILEDQIASSKEKIEILAIDKLIDSTRFSNLEQIIRTCDQLRGCSANELPDNWREQLKNCIKLSQYYFYFPTEELGNELEDAESDANFKFSITLNESVLLNGIYSSVVTGHKMFRKYHIISEPGKSGFAKIYFIAYLDSNNSEMLIGHDSTLIYRSTDSLHKDIIRNTDGYYLVKPFDKANKKGVIKFRVPNGSFEYYPFEIK